MVGALMGAPAIAVAADDGVLRGDGAAGGFTDTVGLSGRLETLAQLPPGDDLSALSPERADQLGAELGVAIEGEGGLQLKDDSVAVSIRYSATPDPADFDALAALAEVVATSVDDARASAWVPRDRLDEVAALPRVASVTEALRPATGTPAEVAAEVTAEVAADDDEAAVSALSAASACRTIEAVALPALRADVAAALHGVDGTGVTVGIISDSFGGSSTAASTPAQDVAAGLLPGPGNPCGHEQPVTVLRDDDTGSTIDEGRGMAQVVHSIAPGARLMFSAVGIDDLTFRDSVLALAAAGADVIVDDVYLFDQSFFEPSLVGLAVQQVVAEGIPYLTSAGNYTNVGVDGPASAGYSVNGWQTDRYRPTACPEAVLGKLAPGDYDCMDFSQPGVFAPSGSPDATASLLLPALEVDRSYALQWAEPWGKAKARFLLALTDPEGDTSVFDPDQKGFPGIGGTLRPFSTGSYDFTIVRDLAGASGEGGPEAAIEPAFTWVWSFRGEIAAAEYYGVHGHDRVGATITGHGGLEEAISVAAIPSDWETTSNAGGVPVAEDFSSIGPARQLFAVTAGEAEGVEPLPEQLVVSKPDVAGVDRILTDFFSPSRPVPDRPGVHSFWGTSAAAPSAAAVVALGRQIAPTATVEDLRDALTGTGRTASSGSVHVVDSEKVGAGLIDAAAFVEALAEPGPTPTPTPAPSPGPDPAPTPTPTAGADTASGGQLAATGFESGSAAPIALAAVAVSALGGLALVTAARRVRRAGVRSGRRAS
ncbi:hypothetical protein GCM10009851_30780 [Herbiconiux moechotypicola]|uniref:Peptidase S8/S53 domain-containing protein n=1 Tax=Herbiconiux moechotypicola TaxID=637393 RepID=A0ABN3DWN4_9MICO